MIPKLSLFKLLKKSLWLMPFLCFTAGYYTLTFFLHNSFSKTPCVIGQPFLKAAEILSAQNLNMQLLSYKEDQQVKPGTVISQNPSPLSSIRPQQTVFLVVAAAPQKAAIGDYTGKNYETVAQELTEQNIFYKKYYVPSSLPQNTCIAQLPQAGQELTSKPLILYTAVTAAPVIVPSFIEKSVLEVSAHLQQEHIPFTIFHAFPVSSDHVCTHCTIVAQKPLAGSSLTKNNPPTFQLHVNG